MLDGLPELHAYIVRMVTAKRQRNPLAMVIHYLLCDLANAAETALTHYFPLTLKESYLQNSKLGSPYQKWAKFTNEDFGVVDQCFERLMEVARIWYEQTIDLRSLEEDLAAKVAYAWFSEMGRQYRSCVVNPEEPFLELGSVNLLGWINEATGRFLNVWNFLPPPTVLPISFAKSNHSIADRQAISSLQKDGLARLLKLRNCNDAFAIWLRANYTMSDATSPHRRNQFVSHYPIG